MTDEITPDTFEQPVDELDEQRHTFSYDRSEPHSVGVAIIRAVASVSDVDALSLEPRLYDVIDPDALERLLSGGQADGMVQISFEFGQHLVTVTNNGKLVVQSFGRSKL